MMNDRLRAEFLRGIETLEQAPFGSEAWFRCTQAIEVLSGGVGETINGLLTEIGKPAEEESYPIDNISPFPCPSSGVVDTQAVPTAAEPAGDAGGAEASAGPGAGGSGDTPTDGAAAAEPADPAAGVDVGPGGESGEAVCVQAPAYTKLEVRARVNLARKQYLKDFIITDFFQSIGYSSINEVPESEYSFVMAKLAADWPDKEAK